MKKLSKIVIGTLAATTLSVVSVTYADSTQTDSTATVQTTASHVSNSTIETQVKESFSKSKVLNSSTIAVTARNGVVYLEGTVDTNTQYEEAVTLAQATDGVTNVDVDKFTVKDSKAPLTDTYTTAKIKGTFLKASMQGKDISVLNTHVETKDGIVYLSGSLDNSQQVTNAIAAAKSVDGVKQVKSELTVK